MGRRFQKLYERRVSMTQEDYCSYELSQLLKEKGFEGVCEYAYSNKGNYFEVDRGNFDEVYCLRPTHQMAMKWLREKYQLLISVDASPIYDKVKDEKGRNTCGLLYWHYMACGEWLNDKHDATKRVFVVSGKTYEEAIEAALKYSLENLI